MANNKPFKIKNGLQATKYLNTSGTITTTNSVFDIGGSFYEDKRFSTASQELTTRGCAFNSNGTRVYVVGNSSDTVFQYDLSTAYDISTASYNSVSFSVNAQDTSPAGIRFKTDGTKMFIVGFTNDAVYEYNLSTAFDISTASYSNTLLSVGSQDTAPLGLNFNSNGTKLYIAGNGQNTIFQYNLSTAWDLSTASYSNISFNVASQDATPVDVAFNSDGTKMYVTGSGNDAVFQYSLSTADDVSTASYDNASMSVGTEQSSPMGGTIHPDGTKFYIVGNGFFDGINQYSIGSSTKDFDLSTGNNFSYTVDKGKTTITFSNPPASGKAVAFSVDIKAQEQTTYDTAAIKYATAFGGTQIRNQEASPSDLAIKPDGTKFFILGTGSNGKIHEYDLSTPDLITPDTVSFVQSKTLYQGAGSDVTETNPLGVAFKPDGTRMYMCGSTNNSVYEFSLSTAWDISTLSYTSVTSIATEGTSPQAIQFKSDGTKMYVLCSSNDTIFQYSLSTAWSASTRSYDSKSFSVGSQEASPLGMYLSSDGTKIYVSGGSADDVFQYNLSTAYDISTASYNSEFFEMSNLQNFRASSIAGITFNSNETKFYITEPTNDTIKEFHLFDSHFRTVSWPNSVKWEGGSAPSLPEYRENSKFVFITKDGGTTYLGKLAGTNTI